MDEDKQLAWHFRWPVDIKLLTSATLHSSPAFEHAGYSWRIQLQCFEKKDVQWIGLYLKSNSASTKPEGWSCSVKYRFEIENASDPTLSVAEVASSNGGDKFTKLDTGWGFATFLRLQHIHDKVLLKDDTVFITVRLLSCRPQPAPTLAHDYDSKKATGYVGLKVQGGVQCANALLQTLYHIPCFRQAVYHVPAAEMDGGESSISILRELQGLFYYMQHRDGSADASTLLKTMEWATCQWLAPLSSGDLARLLCQSLDGTWKIRTGDILCFQKALPPDVAARCRFPDVPSFLQHARELQSVRFRHLANPEKDMFVLALGAASDVLYYEVLDPPGRSRVVSISVHDQRSEVVACFRVPLPPGSTVADVLKLVKAERECAHLGELVVTRVRDGRIHKVLSLTEVIDDVDDGYWSLQVTEKEPQAEPGARLLPVSHVRRNEADGSSERVTAFGQPFMLAIGEQEKLASVKTRLQAKLGAAAKEFARCKFAIVVVDTAVYLDDDDVVLGKYQTLQAGRWDAWPAVVHPAQPRSTPRKRSREEAATPEKEAAPKRLEPRTLRGLQWKRELFLPTFAESASHTAQDPQRLLLEASSSHVDASGHDTWHLAQRTQNLGRALWDTMLELSTLRTSLRTTDDEGQRLSEACRGTEAALMEAVAAAREKPLDAAALSARDQAMEGHVAALRRLEESYARKAALAGERVKQKQMLEGLTRGANPDVDGPENSGQDQAVGKAKSLSRQLFAPATADADAAQAVTMDNIQDALALAGVAVKECNDELMPAATATQAAAELLAKCLARQRAVMARVKGKLDQAHDAGARVIGSAVAVMGGETPAEDAEQAGTLRALVKRKREQLAEMMAAREGLHPTEVRLGMLQRDLRDVKKQKAQARAHLEIAELDEKEKEAAELRRQLDELEDKQRGIVSDLNKLTAEAEDATRKMTQYYPEVAALPERASRLSKALPSATRSNNNRNSGAGDAGSSRGAGSGGDILHQGDPWTAALRVLAFALVQVDPALRPSAEDALSDPQGFLARDLTQVAAEQQRRMHALSSFLESLRRCPARVAGRAHVLKVTDLDNRPQLVEQMLEVFAADGLDLQVLFSGIWAVGTIAQ
eukprot:jgi/Mesvir1/9193/Mv15944-RA.1